MDTLNQYRQIVQDILSEYSSRRSTATIDSQCNFDLLRDHYQVVNVGWENDRRVYGCVLHLDIINNKIWLQYNGTEIDIAQELCTRGVPKSDIVLGFQPLYRRPMTEYAVS
jgi:XisI protein